MLSRGIDAEVSIFLTVHLSPYVTFSFALFVEQRFFKSGRFLNDNLVEKKITCSCYPCYRFAPDDVDTLCALSTYINNTFCSFCVYQFTCDFLLISSVVFTR